MTAVREWPSSYPNPLPPSSLPGEPPLQLARAKCWLSDPSYARAGRCAARPCRAAAVFACNVTRATRRGAPSVVRAEASPSYPCVCRPAPPPRRGRVHETVTQPFRSVSRGACERLVWFARQAHWADPQSGSSGDPRCMIRHGETGTWMWHSRP